MGLQGSIGPATIASANDTASSNPGPMEHDANTFTLTPEHCFRMVQARRPGSPSTAPSSLAGPIQNGAGKWHTLKAAMATGPTRMPFGGSNESRPSMPDPEHRFGGKPLYDGSDTRSHAEP
jgi:hypothetical protein